MRFTEAEIESTISQKILALTGKRISSANEELVESGILTSITLAELAVEIEKVFSISFSFMEVSKEYFASVTVIKNLVCQKLS